MASLTRIKTGSKPKRFKLNHLAPIPRRLCCGLLFQSTKKVTNKQKILIWSAWYRKILDCFIHKGGSGQFFDSTSNSCLPKNIPLELYVAFRSGRFFSVGCSQKSVACPATFVAVSPFQIKPQYNHVFKKKDLHSKHVNNILFAQI